MTDETDTKKRLDGTINLPTLIALIGFMVAQGFLPGAQAPSPDAAIKEAVEAHSASVHADAVPRATYTLEKAHDRETMSRIEAKLDALAAEVREQRGRR